MKGKCIGCARIGWLALFILYVEGGPGDGSVNKVLAVQACTPEFTSPAPMEKVGKRLYTVPREAGAECSLDSLASQSVAN